MAMHRLALMLLLSTLVMAGVAGGLASAQAQAAITVTGQSHEIRFGKEIVLRIQVRGPEEISKITVNYSFGRGNASAYGYATFTPGKEVTAEFSVPVGGAKYAPPGADLTVSYLIEDRAGGKLQTQPETFTYEDTRFQWENLNRDLVTVYYYGGARNAAQSVLDIALATNERIGKQAGVKLTEPVRIWVYASKQDMDPALPFQSATTQQELVTLGQAFTEQNLILMLSRGSPTEVTETATHEFTHLISHQAADSPFSEMPVWLNEGLSVFAEGELPSGQAYLRALQQAVQQDKLIPLRNLASRPGRPDEIILLYGQGYSVVKFMVDTYGPDKMRELLSTLKAGKLVDDALVQVYGFGVDGLDNQWRQTIGAKPIAPRATPAASGQVVVPTLAPMTLPSSSGPATPAPTSAPAAPAPAETSRPTGGLQALTNVALIAAGVGVVVVIGAAAAVMIVFRRR